MYSYVFNASGVTVGGTVRVKTEARRQAIISAAAEVFSERGFDAASMSEISARVGGSRMTLYNYFSSKEELLLEVILTSTVQARDEAIAALHASEDIAAGLREFGTRYLSWVTSPNTLSLLRIGIAQGGSSDYGRLYYSRGPEPGWSAATEFFRKAIRKGKLRADDPGVMAAHFKALCESGLVELQLLGVMGKAHANKLAEKAAEAVDVFLRAYGISSDSKQTKSGRNRNI